MPEWKIPAPLAVAWPLRDVKTATITERRLGDGRLEVKIEHAVLEGVTPAMLRWFISMLDQQLDWQGQRLLAYRLWHPRDHVHHQIHGRRPDGTVVAPVRFHLVEAFGAQRRFLVEQWFELLSLDETGFRLRGKNSGLQLELHETFEAVPGGTKMTVTMWLGTANSFVSRVLVTLASRFKRAQLEAWKRHNVEEDGTLPFFLPELFARHH
ncbi:MAG: hypothetical protein JNK82_45885 [Myxococcaceae bacterium]|nr:hypothetical protein [Myxococcaceae bacterium]